MANLNDIGIRHSTDKSTLHHCYLSLYDMIFSRYRDKPNFRLLELGTQFGFSLRTWREYFPIGTIVGVDSVDNGPDSRATGTELMIAQAYELKTVAELNNLFTQFDIIIDDASHASEDQAWFVEHYSTLVNDDGLLIVEDVPTRGTIGLLKERLPDGFDYASVDMTEGSTIFESRLFIAHKK